MYTSVDYKTVINTMILGAYTKLSRLGVIVYVETNCVTQICLLIVINYYYY